MLKFSELFIKLGSSSKEYFLKIRRFYSNSSKKVAVVLTGCGVLDGTEIHEASAVAVHLTRLGVEPVFYAPSCPQKEVIDHSKGCPTSDVRYCLVEAARIARGKINALNNLQHCHACGVVFPGGFGVAKNLSSFATDGAACSINEEVFRVMHEFHKAKKPQGFICIAAILPARVFPCVKITLGQKGDPTKWPHASAIDAAAQMGAEIECRNVDEVSFDHQNLIFSTPAFMYEGSFCETFNGIGTMIESMCKML